MKEENDIYSYETEDGRTVIGDVESSEEINPSLLEGKEEGNFRIAPKSYLVNKTQEQELNKISPSIIDESLERFFIPKKKPKDPKKVIAALRGEITKKQKEIDILKKVRDYEDDDLKQRGDEIRFLTNRNLWQRIINKKYSR